MNQLALGMLHDAIPYIQDNVRSNDLHVYYCGGQAFGYPEAHDRHELKVVHGKTLVHRWSMHYPSRVDVEFEINAIPRRKASGILTSAEGKLAPLGGLVYTSGKKTAELVARLTGSPEYEQALKRKEVFNTTYFLRTSDVGYFYQHMYAHLVALRTRLEGVVGVGESIKLLDLAGKYSNHAHAAVEYAMALDTKTNFDDFAKFAVGALQAEGVEVLKRYD